VAIAYTCPSCRVVLTSNNPLPAGKAIKCPKCAKPFAPNGNGHGPARPPQQHIAARSVPGRPMPAARPNGPVPIRPSAQNVQKKPKKGSGLMVFFVISFFLLFLLGGGAVGAYLVWVNFGDSIMAGLDTSKTSSSEPVFTTVATSIGNTTGPVTKTPPVVPDPPVKEPPVKEPPPVTPPVQGAVGSDEIAFIPADHNVLIGAKLGSILSMPGVAPLIDPILKDNEDFKFLTDLEKTAGIPFKELVDQVAIGVKAPLSNEAAAGPEAITAVFRSKKPFDRQKVIQALSRGNPLKLAGKEYHMAKQNPGGFTTLLVPNDRIVILTTLTGQKLESLVKADGRKPLLNPEAVTMVRKVEKGQVWLALPLDEAARAELKKSLEPAATDAPPDAKPFFDAVAKARGFTLWGALEEGKFKIAVGLDLTEDQPAKDLTAALQKLWDDGLKTKLTEKEVIATLEKLPPHMQAIVKDVVANTKFTHQGTLVQVALTLATQPWEQFAAEVVAKGPEAFGPLAQFAPAPAGNGDPLAKEEADLLKLTNEYRKKNQLPEFKSNKKLDEAAKLYSMKQAKAGKLDPLPDVEAVTKFADEAGYKVDLINANTAVGPKVTADEVMAFFIKDVDSKGIVLDKKYEEVGIGVAKDEKGNLFYTQVYATPAK
jgi:uncharacterized protein YkwD